MMKPLLLVLSILLIVSCTSPVHKTTADSTKTLTPKDSPAAASQSWTYNQTADNMTTGIDYFASVTATNKLEFKPPYDGGVSATLTIRHLSGKNRLTLTISKGRFTSNNPDGEKVRIKFDSGRAATYNCDPGSEANANTDMIYIHPANNLIVKLKKAKKVIIEAEFLNEGLKQMIFNVDGLQWNHKSVFSKS